MAKDDSGVMWLAVAVFLFIALAPVAAFAFYLDMIPFPALPGGFAVAATAGLFLAAFLLAIAAAVALALRGRKAVKSPARYEWEGYFRAAGPEPELPPCGVQPAAGGGRHLRIIAAVVIIASILVLLAVASVRLPGMDSFIGNSTNATKVTKNLTVAHPVISPPPSEVAKAPAVKANVSDSAGFAGLKSGFGGVRSFASAYRSYILAGILAALGIIGLLFLLERKGKSFS